MTQPLAALGPLATFARGAREALDVLTLRTTRPAVVAPTLIAATPFAARTEVVAARTLATIARGTAPRIFVATLVAEATRGGLSRKTAFATLAALEAPTFIGACAAIETWPTLRSLTALETSALGAIHGAARTIFANRAFGGACRRRLFRCRPLRLATFTVEQHEGRGRDFDGVHSLEQWLDDWNPREM